MEVEKNFENFNDERYDKQKMILTLELYYKFRYIHHAGVDNIVKIIDNFISEKTLKNMKYNMAQAQKKKKI